MKPLTFYYPPDVDAAYEEWGANCGPAAIAALLERPLSAVRPHLVGFERRRYCNPTHVKDALTSLGFEAVPTPDKDWPLDGLAFIQWGGPWLKPGVPVGAAYRNTHWVACRNGGVFDVNLPTWVSRDKWCGVADWILKEVPRSDGTWNIRWSCEVRPYAPVEVF